jgi:aspartate kinase
VVSKFGGTSVGKAKAMDRLYAIGKRLSSTLFSPVRGQELSKKKVQLVDVRNVLKTDSSFRKAIPLLEEIKKKAPLKFFGLINKGHCFIGQGFIGQTLQRETATQGREVSELTTFGATIRHPPTLAPAIRRNVPVFIKSSQNPEKGGICIKKSTKNGPLIRNLTLKKRWPILTFKNPSTVNNYGFLAKIFSVFETHKIRIDSVVMTVDFKTLEQQELVSDLQKLGTVKIEKDLSLVSLVGNKIHHAPGLRPKVLNALQSNKEAQKQINVRPFILGASKHHFSFFMKTDRIPEAISKLHEVFMQGTPKSNQSPIG